MKFLKLDSRMASDRTIAIAFQISPISASWFTSTYNTSVKQYSMGILPSALGGHSITLKISYFARECTSALEPELLPN